MVLTLFLRVGGASVATIGQEDRALELEATADTRNVALQIEAAALGQGGQYPTDVAAVIGESGPWAVDFAVATSSAEEFCIETTHPELPDGGVLVHYDSDGGGIGDGPCP